MKSLYKHLARPPISFPRFESYYMIGHGAAALSNRDVQGPGQMPMALRAKVVVVIKIKTELETGLF